jgi:hypothetical protein
MMQAVAELYREIGGEILQIFTQRYQSLPTICRSTGLSI